MASLKIRIVPCVALATWSLLMINVLPCLSPPAAAAPLFDQTNLVTNDPLAHPAQVTDPHLENAWGRSPSVPRAPSGSPTTATAMPLSTV
jgi:hypothetical protein